MFGASVRCGKAPGREMQSNTNSATGSRVNAVRVLQWVSNIALTPKQRKEFPRFAPEFIVEVMSPSDRLKSAKAKMEQWIANGVQLGWLIDGDAKTVYVYREGYAPKTHKGVLQLAGEGPIDGFVLNLKAIWKGLK